MIIIRTLRKDIANYNREDDIVRRYTPDNTQIRSDHLMLA